VVPGKGGEKARGEGKERKEGHSSRRHWLALFLRLPIIGEEGGTKRHPPSEGKGTLKKGEGENASPSLSWGNGEGREGCHLLLLRGRRGSERGRGEDLLPY